ncbi:MAG: glycoside hydrolase family 3 C-terminal domain-containing protein [Reichenbachiella sp.]
MKILAYFLLALFIVACQPKDKTASSSRRLEFKIDSVLSKMTLQEKIGQTNQRGTSSRVKGCLSKALKTAVKEGRIGAMLNVMNTDYVEELQKIAIEESPNGIPLIFGRDVIHGFKTIFPIPLAQAASFNPELVKEGSRIAAKEASTSGIRWTFAPMLDISRDARWGRIAESAGEDPYLTEVMGKAYIEGFQGDLSNPYSIAACAKHFVAYGAAEGGRDYNSSSMSDEQLQNVYLRPFAQAVESDVATFMTSFNDLNGVPASGNKFILKNMLREAWGFDGFVVSDWNSIIEMIKHGFTKDKKQAAEKALNAGLDMEMMSQSYENYTKELIEEGKFTESQLDDLVRNILRIKFKLGLFETTKFDKDTSILYASEHLEAAKQSAIESAVLLKNYNDVLPISDKTKRIALIGPLANAPHEQLGTWTFDGEKDYTITPLQAFNETFGESNILYTAGLENSRDTSSKGFSKALSFAKSADVILFFGGEEAILSGEAHSRANIDLPGAQEQLIKELAKLNKKIVLIIMAGRPITIGNIVDNVDAILFAGHPGTMGGPALTDLILGEVSPSGKLPFTWPKSVGQIPMYYNHKNTGRPASKESYIHMDDIPVGAWQSSLGNESHYLDDGYEPMYPFGYGLTYSSVVYSNLSIDNPALKMGDNTTVKVDLKNEGNRDVKEVVQLYIQDCFGSITRPVKELLRFKKSTIKSGETKTIEFEFNTEDLKFYNIDGEWVTEPGEFKLWVGTNSASGLEKAFIVE